MCSLFYRLRHWLPASLERNNPLLNQHHENNQLLSTFPRFRVPIILGLRPRRLILLLCFWQFQDQSFRSACGNLCSSLNGVHWNRGLEDQMKSFDVYPQLPIRSVIRHVAPHPVTTSILLIRFTTALCSVGWLNNLPATQSLDLGVSFA